MLPLSERTRSLGTENAFVVLKDMLDGIGGSATSRTSASASRTS